MVEWQLAAVLMIVSAAAIFVIRQTIRSWQGKKAGCNQGCGCGPANQDIKFSQPALITSEQLLVKLRQNANPEH